jgi:hypothetical protein
MEIMDIIKEAFIFPSNNLEKLAIYIVLTFVLGLIVAGGVITTVAGVNNSSVYLILAAILFIISIIVALIISGYQLAILKSGIDLDDEAPSFDWKNDLITGIKLIIVNIVYMIIPAIIVGIVALITNVPGNMVKASQEVAANSANVTAIANSTAPVVANISDSTAAALASSFAITAIVGLILVIIFAFFLTMGQSRLANTGSLGEALNIPEAARDISRIGVGKVIAVVLLIIVVIGVIQAILGYVYGQVPQLSLLSIIVTPYLAFFSQRAYGLLYSDIA